MEVYFPASVVFELGLERTGGFKTVWQVENDPFAQKVLAKHWPDVRRWDDVRTFPPAEGEWGCDLICGGFPCQDISNAGKQAGIDGERSGLWQEFARVIRVVRPRFVLVENVAALLVRGVDRVLGDMAEIGYDAEWAVISAADVGACHLRKRIFILAYPMCHGLERETLSGNNTSPNGKIESRSKTVRRSASESIAANSASSRRNAASHSQQGGSQEADGEAGSHSAIAFGGRGGITRSDWWLSEPGVGRVVDGVSPPVDRLRCLGNAIVPQIAEWIGNQLLATIRS